MLLPTAGGGIGLTELEVRRLGEGEPSLPVVGPNVEEKDGLAAEKSRMLIAPTKNQKIRKKNSE